MKIGLTYKEANLVEAILWQLAQERETVNGSLGDPWWRLTDSGADLCKSVMDKLETANEKENAKTGKNRDLSGAPEGTIQEARWSE